jgi:hypothetical protein
MWFGGSEPRRHVSEAASALSAYFILKSIFQVLHILQCLHIYLHILPIILKILLYYFAHFAYFGYHLVLCIYLLPIFPHLFAYFPA